MSDTEISTSENAWQACLSRLQDALSPLVFDTWIKPLQAKFEKKQWILFAPNDFVKETVKEKYLPQIQMHQARADSIETVINTSNNTDDTDDTGAD